MTNGTSQGLFIVVAIVIFGIFVGLAYTAFGKGGLSNDLKSIFTTATEQSSNSILKSNGTGNLITSDNLLQHDSKTSIPSGQHFTISDLGVITLSSDGESYVGIRLDDKTLNANTKYKMTYKMKVKEGIIKSMGGHMSYSDKTEVYIDDKLVSDTNLEEDSYLTDWHKGIPLNSSKDTFDIEIVFNTNGYDDINAPSVHKAEKYKSMYIQPNRIDFGETYTVEITDLAIYKQ